MASTNAHSTKGLLSQLDDAVTNWLAKDGYLDTTSVKRAVDLSKFELQKDIDTEMQQYIDDHRPELEQDLTERAQAYASGGGCPGAAKMRAQKEIVFEVRQTVLEERDPPSYQAIHELEHGHLDFKLSQDKVPLGFLDKLPDLVGKNVHRLGDDAYATADALSLELRDELDLDNGFDDYSMTVVAKACGANLKNPAAKIYESTIVMKFDHKLDDTDRDAFEGRLKSEGYAAFEPEVTQYAKGFALTTSYELDKGEVIQHKVVKMGEFKGQYEHTDLLGLCPSLSCAGAGYDAHAPLTMEAPPAYGAGDGPCGGCGGCG
ncbi:MAG: hypothetical protein QF415_04795 [Candidatus Undinarchaeales archaeon]|nr:hypothetical protein [Candidatus Undinarchaeales archaeon]MDP7493331.1 hypothetical protein [Candidatus Undinarchaeales archaeon]